MMDWQLPAVGVAIVLSVAYVFRAAIRTWSPKGKGCSSCGSCAAGAEEAPANRITLPMMNAEKK